MSTPPAPPASSSTGKPCVLITGAAGRIGSSFAGYAHERYRLKLMVMPGDANAEKIAQYGEVVEVDLANLDALREAMKGVDACVHLAGQPSPYATWSDLLATNVVGTYNLYVAAKAGGCRRVVYASSIHAVSGYPADVQVKPTEPVNPGDVYGVSKCFGEALGRYMAEQEGVSGVAIRIGAHQPDGKIESETGLRLMDAWVSPRDLNQLIAKSIDATNIKFLIVHGLSDNRFKRLDITNAREILGYAPEDDSAVTNDQLAPLHLPETVMAHDLSDAKDRRAASGLREDLPAI